MGPLEIIYKVISIEIHTHTTQYSDQGIGYILWASGQGCVLHDSMATGLPVDPHLCSG